MKIMVIGGAGFLGINIALNLVQAGHGVIIVDKNCQHLGQKNHINGVKAIYNLNIGNCEGIIKIIEDHSVECIINLVSTLIPSSGVDSFSSDIELCAMPAFRLISELANRRVKYVYFSSGGSIYGKSAHEFLSESDECNPINFYGYSKLMFEEYIKFCGRSLGLDYLIIRPSNPYGTYQNTRGKQGFIAIAMSCIISGESIEIWGDGSVIRDYVFVSDMANALTSILGRNIWNTAFNIGSGAGHSLLEVVEVMKIITGKQVNVIHKESRSVDVARIVLDISKIKDEIEFNPIGLHDGIEKYYKSLVNTN